VQKMKAVISRKIMASVVPPEGLEPSTY